MRHLFLTFLIYLLVPHVLAVAGEPETDAPSGSLVSPTTGESQDSIPSADGKDTCPFINERQLEYCLAEKAERAEAELNKIYKEIMASLDKERQNALRKEERAWIKWREAECARQAKNVEDCVDGCGVPTTMQVVCMRKEANTRVQQLKLQWHR